MTIINQPSTVLTMPIDQSLSDWSIVLPVGRRNLVTNPSLELATTGWSAVGGSIARTADQAYHGAYSLAVTPGAGTNSHGAAWAQAATVNGSIYAASIKLRGTAGRLYRIQIWSGSAEVAARVWRASGRWDWVWVVWVEGANANRTLRVLKESHDGGVFYLDGAQIERVEATTPWPSTYIDGDQPGYVAAQIPAAYLWEGASHASTSVRSAQTRAGGIVMRLDQFGVVVLAAVGLGLATPALDQTTYAQLDGGQLSRIQKTARDFSLAVRFDGATPAELQRLRSALGAGLDRDDVAIDQPLQLIYQPRDACGELRGDAITVPCAYVGGGEGNWISRYTEVQTLTFRTYLPYWIGQAEQGAALNVQNTLSSVSGVLARNPETGLWTNAQAGPGAAREMTNILPTDDGRFLVSGNFTTLGGTAANRIAYYDPRSGAVSALAGGANNTVFDAARLSGGDIVAIGVFTGNVARWNGSAWSGVGSPPVVDRAGVRSAGTEPRIAVDLRNDWLYLTAQSLKQVWRWNGSTWANLGTSTLNPNDIVVDPSGAVYVAFDGITTIGAATASAVARWDGSAWASLGTLNSPIRTLRFINGALYAASGTSIFRWNGNSWSVELQLDAGSTILTFESDAQGGFFLGGLNLIYQGRTYQSAVRWRGGLVQSIEAENSGSAYGVGFNPGSGALALVVYELTVPATVVTPGVTAVINRGTGRAYPIVTITGPSSGVATIYSLVNLTTAKTITFNLTIAAGEAITLDFNPSQLSFTSSSRGNIASTLVAGSNVADFFFNPGTNIINFYSSAPSVTATARWRPTFVSIDGAIP